MISNLGLRDAVATKVNPKIAIPQKIVVRLSMNSRSMDTGTRHIIQNNWYNQPSKSSDRKYSFEYGRRKYLETS